MSDYVALLRGINVGRNNRIAMADLRQLLTDLGYTDVRTYLQSGNAVFQAANRSAAAVRTAIEGAIRQTLGLDIKVLVRTGRQLDAVIAANELPTTDAKKLHVAFLDAAPAAASLRESICSLAFRARPCASRRSSTSATTSSARRSAPCRAPRFPIRSAESSAPSWWT